MTESTENAASPWAALSFIGRERNKLPAGRAGIDRTASIEAALHCVLTHAREAYGSALAQPVQGVSHCGNHGFSA